MKILTCSCGRSQKTGRYFRTMTACSAKADITRSRTGRRRYRVRFILSLRFSLPTGCEAAEIHSHVKGEMNGCRSSPLDTPCSFCHYADMSCKSFPVFHAIYHFTFLYRILDFTHNLKKNPKIIHIINRKKVGLIFAP